MTHLTIAGLVREAHECASDGRRFNWRCDIIARKLGAALTIGAGMESLGTLDENAPKLDLDDVRKLVRFIVGYWPGLEDGIDWPDTDQHPTYLAALRLRAALWPNAKPITPDSR